MHCIIVGFNIKNAPIELLEQLSVHHSQVRDRDREIAECAHIGGVVVLSTCNRLEYLATTDDVDAGTVELRDYLAAGCAGGDCDDILDDFIYSYADDMAIRHLFEVVCGLDSLILGEAEILGQVARAYKAATEAGSCDKLINVWFQRALHLGKKARSETSLGHHPISVGHIAADLAISEFGGVEGRQVLILGAGEVCELTMKYLVAYKFPVVMVTNRSHDKACSLADEYGFEAHHIDSLEECLAKADMVFSATSARRFMIDADMVKRAMEGRSERHMVFFDMAVPRDVDPSVSDIDGVRVYNINELRDVADRNQTERALAADAVRQLIEVEVADFRAWIQSLELVPVITALRKYADDIKDTRLQEALDKLNGLSPSQIHTVDVLATTITNQLVRNPIEQLHANAGSPKAGDYADALCELFDLDLDTDDASTVREQSVV